MQNQHFENKQNFNGCELQEANTSQASFRSTSSKASSLFRNQTEVAFIYDIPKKDDIFMNKSMSEFFVIKGFEGSQVQILKSKQEDYQKPFWSGRVKFSSEALRARACAELKYFEMGGHWLRLLSYDQNLSPFQHTRPISQSSMSGTMQRQGCQPKPDNSEENCNIVVKGLEPSMTDFELEEYFATRYGPVRNCKIAKEPMTGRSKTYGFVWFEEGRHANAAMLDSKAGKTPFAMDWYKILAQRPSLKMYSDQPVFDQVCITWRKIGSDLSTESLQKEDLRKYYSKFGRIVDIDFQSENNRAMIAFERSIEAEFAVAVTKIVIRNHSVWAKPMKERTQQSHQGSTSRQQTFNDFGSSRFDPSCNLIVKNLEPSISDHAISGLLSSFGTITSLKLNRKAQTTFAYVAYADKETSQFALHSLDGSFHFGRQLSAEPYKTPEQRHSQSGSQRSATSTPILFNAPLISKTSSRCSNEDLKQLCSTFKEYLIQAVQMKEQSSLVQAQKVLKKFLMELGDGSPQQHHELSMVMLSSPKNFEQIATYLDIFAHKQNPEEEVSASDKQFDNFHKFTLQMLETSQK